MEKVSVCASLCLVQPLSGTASLWFSLSVVQPLSGSASLWFSLSVGLIYPVYYHHVFNSVTYVDRCRGLVLDCGVLLVYITGL